ncbi:hypothetical protein HDE_01036 [Halotydeus destructor]|nr:hypothetical protein HDE_01036 [Halotydeus destructor]
MRPLIWRAVVMDFNVTVFSHPSYKYGTNIYDIGLIKLLKPLTGLPESVYNGELINTICYDSSHTFSYACGENVYFSGYGAKEQDVPAPHLTWTHISPIDTKLSTALNQIVRFKTPEVLHPSNVRFRNNEHGVVRQPCGGDSGGPYVWYVQDEKSKTPSPEVSPYRAVLIGTEIGGPACKDPVRDPDLGNLLGFEMGTKFQDRFIHRWVVETMRDRSRKVRKDVAIPPAPSFLENRPPFFVDKGFGLD